MNPKTQYHIGTILKALGDLGQHLMGADLETVSPAPAITGEPTTDKPKAGRPRKTAEPVAAPAQAVSEPVVAASAFSALIETKPPEDDFGAVPPSSSPFASYEEARAFIDPFVKNHPGEVTKIIAGLLPEGKTSLRALIEFPEKHPEFIKQILALK